MGESPYIQQAGLNFINKGNGGGVNVGNECLDGERIIESDKLRSQLMEERKNQHMGEKNETNNLKLTNASGDNTKLSQASGGETEKREVARKASGGSNVGSLSSYVGKGGKCIVKGG